MITVPFTQMHMFFSMLITEIFLLGDPNYTVRIGDENYFSLAVGGLIGLIFLFSFIAIKFGSKIQFKGYLSKTTINSEFEKRKQVQIIKIATK
jgi:hypothetical protein